MLIICDKKLPQELRHYLSGFADVLEFSTKNIVYESISGHPDIFFHKYKNSLIFAPNTPEYFLEIIEKTGIQMIEGKKPLGIKYPATVLYNAIATDKNLFCHKNFIDKSILNLHSDKEIIHLNQAYVACNMLIGKKTILTSDLGICKRTLSRYFNPKEIFLEGVSNGFIGGCCCILNDKIFVNGNLKFVVQAKIIEDFALENEIEIIELYQGKLFDGGGFIVI